MRPCDSEACKSLLNEGLRGFARVEDGAGGGPEKDRLVEKKDCELLKPRREHAGSSAEVLSGKSRLPARRARSCAFVIFSLGCLGNVALGQDVSLRVEPVSAGSSILVESSSLPEAPEPVQAREDEAGSRDRQAEGGPAPAGQRQVAVAGPFDKFVQQGEVAPHLSAGDKVMIGLRGSVSPYALIGWVSSATYSEAIDGSPHYGQGGTDYLQRLGAAAARATSEDIFTNSVAAPLLHEDPRYYQMGPGHSFVKRAAYSVMRTVVTKTDTGGETVNFAVLGGNLAGSALTQAYYPPSSRGFDEVMKTWGTSLLGQAVGNLFEEFVLSSAEFLQLKHRIL